MEAAADLFLPLAAKKPPQPKLRGREGKGLLWQINFVLLISFWINNILNFCYFSDCFALKLLAK